MKQELLFVAFLIIFYIHYDGKFASGQSYDGVVTKGKGSGTLFGIDPEETEYAIKTRHMEPPPEREWDVFARFKTNPPVTLRPRPKPSPRPTPANQTPPPTPKKSPVPTRKPQTVTPPPTSMIISNNTGSSNTTAPQPINTTAPGPTNTSAPMPQNTTNSSTTFSPIVNSTNATASSAQSLNISAIINDEMYLLRHVNAEPTIVDNFQSQHLALDSAPKVRIHNLDLLYAYVTEDPWKYYIGLLLALLVLTWCISKCLVNKCTCGARSRNEILSDSALLAEIAKKC